MAELIPCPMHRLPCFYETDNKLKRGLADFVFGLTDFETHRKMRVKSHPLGCCRIFLSSLFVVYYLRRELVLEKSYLEKSLTSGFARMTIQHPVVNFCNPLDPGCRTNFTPPADLPYCPAPLVGGLQTGVGLHPVGCVYLDEYEIFKFDSGNDPSSFLIPTRISRIEQTLNATCATVGCDQPYTIVSEAHDFVADIDNYTLLLDHSFLCEDIGKIGNSYEIAGFVRDCNSPEAHGSEEGHGWSLPSFGEEECPSRMIPGAPADMDLPAIREGYDAEGESEGIRSLPIGDVLKVSELMRIAEIDLDDVQGAGDQRGSVRYEGEAIIIEIHYLNYKEGHLPNSLPPIYEYHVYRLPANTYKMTFVPQMPMPQVLAPHRTVLDVHGIHVEVRVKGKIGKFSVSRFVMIFLEMVALLGLFTWLLTCVSFNITKGKKGDAFYNEVHKEYDIEHLVAGNELLSSGSKFLMGSDGYYIAGTTR